MERKRRVLNLSAREEQLLKLSAEGMTDKEIAQQLTISFSSVSSYWQRIRSKLGTGSRAELVARVMQRDAEERLREKDSVTEQLQQEITVRERTEAELEERVRTRTQELLETIDQLKVAESALKSRESQLTAILEHIPDLIIRFDREFRIDFLSESTVRIFGGEMNDFEGKRINEVDIPEPVKVTWTERLNRLFVCDASKPVTIQFIGEVRKNWFEATLVPEQDTSGRTTHVIVVIRDITERIEATAEIRKRREIFETVWNTASDGMVLCNVSGDIIAANPAFCGLMHLDPEKVTRLRMDEALHPNERTAFMNRFREGIAGNRDFRRPARRVQLHDGDWIECESRISFLREEGIISQVLIVVREKFQDILIEGSLRNESTGFAS